MPWYFWVFTIIIPPVLLLSQIVSAIILIYMFKILTRYDNFVDSLNENSERQVNMLLNLRQQIGQQPLLELDQRRMLVKMVEDVIKELNIQ